MLSSSLLLSDYWCIEGGLFCSSGHVCSLWLLVDSDVKELLLLQYVCNYFVILYFVLFETVLPLWCHFHQSHTGMITLIR